MKISESTPIQIIVDIAHANESSFSFDMNHRSFPTIPCAVEKEENKRELFFPSSLLS